MCINHLNHALPSLTICIVNEVEGSNADTNLILHDQEIRRYQHRSNGNSIELNEKTESPRSKSLGRLRSKGCCCDENRRHIKITLRYVKYFAIIPRCTK